MRSLLTLTKKGRWPAAGMAGVGVLALAVAGSMGMGFTPQTATAAGGKCAGSPTVSREVFGQTADPYTPNKIQDVYRYTLANCHGMSVQILTYGAIVQSVTVPDKHGHPADVVLGFKTLDEYVQKASPPVTANGGPYFGETIGRYGNRIAKGTFHLNDQTYTLPINNGVNSLHGGLNGFGNHIWADQPVQGNGTAGVQLTLISPNGDEGYPKTHAGCTGFPDGCTGYPAQLKVVVTYTLDNSGNLRIHYTATNQDPKLATVVNLTNHSYFNLAGEGSGTAAYQPIRINADSYTPTDSTQIPTGAIVPVAGTPFDFTKPRTIASGIEDCTQPNSLSCQQLLISQGYDHNWVLNKQTAATTGPDGLNLAATAFDPGSGRKLTVWTDQPGVQFYTSNFLNGTLVGISGHIYRQTQAYTFETQHFPDSPNQPNFPSTVLGPNSTLNSETIFQFAS